MSKITLLEGLCKAASIVFETEGMYALKAHPDYEEGQKRLKEAVEAVRAKLSFDEYDLLESANGAELMIYFDMV